MNFYFKSIARALPFDSYLAAILLERLLNWLDLFYEHKQSASLDKQNLIKTIKTLDSLKYFNGTF